MLNKSKAQISMEYLIIIGLSFAILVPGGYFFYNYSQSSNEATVRTQITQIGNTILTNAESIYGLSDGSMVTLTLRYPKNILDVYIMDDKELIIRYQLSSGINEAVFFSKVALSGNYTYPRSIATPNCTRPCENSTITSSAPQQGSHQLKFESKTKYVLITQTK